MRSNAIAVPPINEWGHPGHPTRPAVHAVAVPSTGATDPATLPPLGCSPARRRAGNRGGAGTGRGAGTQADGEAVDAGTGTGSTSLPSTSADSCKVIQSCPGQERLAVADVRCTVPIPCSCGCGGGRIGGREVGVNSEVPPVILFVMKEPGLPNVLQCVAPRLFSAIPALTTPSSGQFGARRSLRRNCGRVRRPSSPRRVYPSKRVLALKTIGILVELG